MSGIFNSFLFNNTIFNTGGAGVVVEDVIKTGTGGIDPKRRKTIYKPTGLLSKQKPKDRLEERLEETRETHEEIKREIALSFREEVKPISQMTMAEVDREIGVLLRKKLEDDEQDMMLVMAIALDE